MIERLLGMETEYGLSVLLRSGSRGSIEHAAEGLLHLAEGIPHLPAMRSSGMFLANGSRFYVDCGTHPEFATPECANPWDVCRYVAAGDHMLMDLASRLRERDRDIARVSILKNNIDYQTRSTWGCHESYLHRGTSQALLARHIIPHLVSRIVYSGAGGFNCFSPGVEFMLSPRVAHLNTAISGDSTSDRRGIFHTREESLSSRGYGRMHILCGESLRGQTGAWLKVSATALVVALIEAGKNPASQIELVDPVGAMRAFATDPSCTRRVLLANGHEVTAVNLQQHYLDQAETYLHASFMPPWAGDVCRHWRAMLDRLEHGAARVSATLDWSIKLALFQNHAQRCGTTLEVLANWTPILTSLAAALTETDSGPRILTTDLVLGTKSPLGRTRKELAPLLRERGLDWDGLPAVLALRLELFEIDTRCGMLGEGGIFDALDAAGVLEHRFSGVDNIPHALEKPPAVGRAALRGACIRRVAEQNGRFAADWEGVWDLQEGHQLDLADPFATAEKWTPHREMAHPAVSLGRLFREGRYADLLDHLPPGRNGNSDDVVLSYARLGRRDEALLLLCEMQMDPGDFRRFALEFWIYSTGLVPDVAAIEPLIDEGNQFIEQADDLESDYSGFVFLCCKALFFMQKDLLHLAEPLLVALLANPAHTIRSRMYSRAECHLADIFRRRAGNDEARELVEKAMRTHREERLHGDSASHTLPMLAKLAADDGQAGEFLERAEAIHREQRNPLGLAHILALRARRLGTPSHRAEIERLFSTVPVLTTCLVARRILAEWDAWISPPAALPIDYWGL